MDWITGIQNAINYIEDHLTGEIDYEQAAKESFSSSFHFQRVFSILCGCTLGDAAKWFEHISIPAGQYMICETERCMFPTNLVDDLRRQAVSEWLPSSGYELRDAPELGVIHWTFEEDNDRSLIGAVFF